MTHGFERVQHAAHQNPQQTDDTDWAGIGEDSGEPRKNANDNGLEAGEEDVNGKEQVANGQDANNEGLVSGEGHGRDEEQANMFVDVENGEDSGSGDAAVEPTGDQRGELTNAMDVDVDGGETEADLEDTQVNSPRILCIIV